MINKGSFLSLLLLVVCILLAQIESYAQEDRINFRGSVSLGAFNYVDSGSSTLRPFGASLHANATISYKSISIPLGISLNNQGTNFQNPFNRYGISPTYKWAKVHLGWRRMRFSKFTMQGLQFFGAGIELTPGVFYLSAMSGRVDYRIPGVPKEVLDNLPKRNIMAAKVGIGNRNNSFRLTFMKAKDQLLELDTIAQPKENAAIGTELRLSFLKNRITFIADGGLSVFTENRKIGNERLESLSIPSFASSIIEPNYSTHINYAGEAELGFHLGSFSLKNVFRRIMPEYQSLGLNYLRNDVQSISVSPSLKLWGNKVLLSGVIGIEENNLDDLRNIDQSRLISSGNLNLRPNNNHNINLQYANFSFDQTVQFDSLLTNSVVIKQITHTTGGSYNYSKTSGPLSKIISFNVNLQNANNISVETISNQTLAAVGSYTLLNSTSNRSVNFGVNYFDVSFEGNSVKQTGLNVGYSYRGDKNQLNIQGGSLLNIDKKNFNSHLSFRYKRSMSRKVSLELSSRARYNQLSSKENRLILRSDFRLVMKL